jgi:hypothetical protein
MGPNGTPKFCGREYGDAAVLHLPSFAAIDRRPSSFTITGAYVVGKFVRRLQPAEHDAGH